MRAYLRALSVLACAAASHAASVNLLNHGFESGLGGWVTTGNVQALGSTSVVTFNDIAWNITPNGSQMAALNSNGVQANTLGSFFGIAGNALQALNQQGLHADPNAGGALTNGSGIYQDFWGNAGDTVTMFYNYVARDYIPASVACLLANSAKFVLTRHVLFGLKPFNKFASSANLVANAPVAFSSRSKYPISCRSNALKEASRTRLVIFSPAYLSRPT